MTYSRALTRAMASVAIAATAALAVPALASAGPADTSPANPLGSAISSLTQSAGDPASLAAAAAIEKTADTPGPDLGTLFKAANDVLAKLGMQPFFYPTAALNCSTVPGVPLGIVPAVAGGVPGGWPGDAIFKNLFGIAPPLGLDANLIKDGNTLFALVPAGTGIDQTDQSGVQVAWFNLSTMKGGLANADGLVATLTTAVNARIDELLGDLGGPVKLAMEQVLKLLPTTGIRLAPVETGKGTILAAMWGTVNTKAVDGSTSSCWFFPTVGLINNP